MVGTKRWYFEPPSTVSVVQNMDETRRFFQEAESKASIISCLFQDFGATQQSTTVMWFFCASRKMWIFIQETLTEDLPTFGKNSMK
eukprot:UN02384